MFRQKISIVWAKNLSKVLRSLLTACEVPRRRFAFLFSRVEFRKFVR